MADAMQSGPNQSDAETARLNRYESSAAIALGSDQSDAETARLSRYEGEALEQEAANNRTLLNAANKIADSDYYGPGAFASSTAQRRQEIAVQDASNRVEQGFGTAEDIKLLKSVGWFPSPQRIDSSVPVAGPSGLTKGDGSPATYSFNERTKQAYWDLGEDNRVRAIPQAFKQPTLQEVAFADPSNRFASGPRLGSVLADLGVVSGAGALGLGLGGVAASGVVGFAADVSALGLRGAYYANGAGIATTGVVAGELALGWNAVAPSASWLGSGVPRFGAKLSFEPSLSTVDRYFGIQAGEILAESPVARASYARLQRQGTEVRFVNDPTMSEMGLFDANRNTVTVNMLHHTSADEAASTVVHEATHQNRFFQGGVSPGTQYEEYLAFRNEFLFSNGRRPTLPERQRIIDLVQSQPDYSLLPPGPLPRFGR